MQGKKTLHIFERTKYPIRSITSTQITPIKFPIVNHIYNAIRRLGRKNGQLVENLVISRFPNTQNSTINNGCESFSLFCAPAPIGSIVDDLRNLIKDTKRNVTPPKNPNQNLPNVRSRC